VVGSNVIDQIHQSVLINGASVDQIRMAESDGLGVSRNRSSGKYKHSKRKSPLAKMAVNEEIYVEATTDNDTLRNA